MRFVPSTQVWFGNLSRSTVVAAYRQFTGGERDLVECCGGRLVSQDRLHLDIWNQTRNTNNMNFIW